MTAGEKVVPAFEAKRVDLNHAVIYGANGMLFARMAASENAFELATEAAERLSSYDALLTQRDALERQQAAIVRELDWAGVAATRVCEGGGPENVAASVGATIVKLVLKTSSLTRRRDALEAREKVLLTAVNQAASFCESLSKYVRHHSMCSISGSPLPIALANEVGCTCGASDALKGALLSPGEPQS